MDTNKLFLVYAWLDENDNPFYIGRTCCLKDRNRNHRYRMKIGVNLPKYNKLKKLIRQGYPWKTKVLEDGIVGHDINDREIFWISHYRKIVPRLYNLTDGGDGTITFTAEQQKKMADARRGTKRSDETKKRMSEAHKGIKFSDEHKMNLSKARQKRTTTKETRKRMSESSTGVINIGQYKLIDPDNNEHITERGLLDFCREHDLTPTNLHKVLAGKRKHHKGWTIERL